MSAAPQIDVAAAGQALDEALAVIRGVVEDTEGDCATVVARLVSATKIWAEGDSEEREALRAVKPAELVGLIVTTIVQEIEATPVRLPPAAAPPSDVLEGRWLATWESLPPYARLPQSGIGLIARMICDEFPDPGDAGMVADLLIRRLAPRLGLGLVGDPG